MSRVEKPKANNRKILRPYSQSTLNMLERGDYNHGRRPSGHTISENSFLTNNGGSIMPNVIEVESINPDEETRLPGNAFSISHTVSNDYYQRNCKEQGIETHPARMPLQLVDIFLQFLTDENDLVLDPFAGSNTTGFCAEKLGRRWVGIEANKEYLKHSQIRLSELAQPQAKTPLQDTPPEGETHELV
jgi:site-specific DNA-methyltransferase (cytosine-N4-specific)